MTLMNTALDDLLQSIEPMRRELPRHRLYGSISNLEALRKFMEFHVFAVWDFMTLLKALQRSFSCVELPWLPTNDRESRRLINEIVLAEESDDDGRGGTCSHFELYLEAMNQAGAQTSAIQSFLDALRRGEGLASALDIPSIPAASRKFVRVTWGVVESGSLAAIASAFTLGREELIPELFEGLIGSIEAEDRGRVELFRDYLTRHVHLDRDEHGPMALRMLNSACGNDPALWKDARFAAVTALEARRELWDGALTEICAVSGRA
jgi:hypothetical protein